MSRKTERIVVARDYSRYPMGRDDDDGPFNGQRFRKEFLIPLLRDPEVHKVVVDLRDLKIQGSSFLEESFGGLVREGIKDEDLNKLSFITDRKYYELEIKEFIDKAKSDLQKIAG